MAPEHPVGGLRWGERAQLRQVGLASISATGIVFTEDTFSEDEFQVPEGPTSADIEAYSPPYLRRGIRPQSLDISASRFARGCPVRMTIAPTMQITSVVLMGTSVTTHWVDAGVPRRLVLPVDQTGETVIATLPTDPDIFPLGHYMVFAMADDIPSVARIVQITADPPLPGDLDGDGELNGSDIRPFVSAITSPP